MRIVKLIENTDLTFDNLNNIPASMDLDDIDLLADSILSGVEGWVEKKEADELRTECWAEILSRLITLLGR